MNVLAVILVSIILCKFMLIYATFLDLCIENIIKKHYKDNFVIYTTRSDLTVDYPLVRINLSEPFYMISQYSNVDMYILSQEGNISDVMDKLSSTREFTPRGLFLIVSDASNIDYIFSVIVKYYIYRVIVLETRRNGHIIFHSYKPFQEESVNPSQLEKFIVGKCSLDSFSIDESNMFLPNKWRNTTVNVLIMTQWAPYVILEGDEVKGVEMDIFGIIQHRLGFKTNFIRTDYPYWGIRLENGTYNMVLRDLQTKQGDMVMGMFHSKFTEHLDFDMTSTFSQDAVYWVVPAAKVIPAWRRISLIFSISLWLALVVSLLALTAIMYILYRERFFSSLYQILIEQGISYTRSSDSFRIILTSWFLACLILTTAFKGNMMIIFIGNIFGFQMESLKDIVESGMPIYLDHDMAKLFTGSSNPYEKYVIDNYLYALDERGINNRTAFAGDIVTADIKRIHKYLFPKYYVKPDGTPLLHMLQDFLFPVNVRWYFVKGYPLAHQIDGYILRIGSAGIIFKLWNTLDYEIKESLGKLEKFLLKALSLSDLSIAFFTWSCGILAATMTFIIEVLIARSHNFHQYNE